MQRRHGADPVRAPVPPLMCAVALIVIALATSQPLVVAAALIGASALLLASPPPHGVMLRVAIISGLVIALLNPFVAVEGDHVLVAGPQLWLFDLEVTSEELLYGAVAGARLATAILATAAFLRLADPDRTLALASRIAPRSALTVALSARLVPTLRRDATGLNEALRLRGAGPTHGRLAGLRRGAALVEPLVASSLERGIDVSEAMAARGYGAGPIVRLPEAPLTTAERIALTAGSAGLVLAALLVTGVAHYSIYPTADAIVTSAGLVLGALTLVMAGSAAVALGGRT